MVEVPIKLKPVFHTALLTIDVAPEDTIIDAVINIEDEAFAAVQALRVEGELEILWQDWCGDMTFSAHKGGVYIDRIVEIRYRPQRGYEPCYMFGQRIMQGPPF